MNQYITGSLVKRLRERRHMTQLQLAEQIMVSDKAISKWETGRGYPDITLIEPLSRALGVSVIELLSGADVQNANRAFDMKRFLLYVCPICGNVIWSTGSAVISCCGIVLPPQEAEEEDGNHAMAFERVEDEYFASIPHEMTKTHYISFILAAGEDGVEIKKLYPEGDAQARFKIRGNRYLYYYCSRHGLFRVPVSAKAIRNSER